MTGKRRKKGEGALVERKDAKGKVIGYAAILDQGWNGGKRQRRWFRGKTQREVLDLLAEARHHAKQGTLPPAGRRSVEAWLEQWLRDVSKPKVRPSTYRGYELAVRHHIAPALGSIDLTKLTAGDVRGFLNSRKGLSPRSVHGLRAVLRNALNRAVDDGLLAHNVVAGRKLAVTCRTRPRKPGTRRRQSTSCHLSRATRWSRCTYSRSTPACARARFLD